tara:strand:- start:23623 stop:23913 length:291 start_codon:yes stop_codon:yes gene_type:complete
MKLISDETLRQIGIDPAKEMGVVTPAGQYFIFPTSESEKWGVSYVRFVDYAGTEQAYWDAEEWGTGDRDLAEGCMGAILACLVSGAHLTELSEDKG